MGTGSGRSCGYSPRKLCCAHEADVCMALGKQLAAIRLVGPDHFPLDYYPCYRPKHPRSLLGGSTSTLIKVVSFGLLWGAGATLFGLGISRVGMALGFALILGITASFGSLFPLAILHPEQLSDRRGLGLILGTVVMTVGLVFLARAGRIRERDLTQTSSGSGFTLGLVICAFSGIFS